MVAFLRDYQVQKIDQVKYPIAFSWYISLEAIFMGVDCPGSASTVGKAFSFLSYCAIPFMLARSSLISGTG